MIEFIDVVIYKHNINNQIKGCENDLTNQYYSSFLSDFRHKTVIEVKQLLKEKYILQGTKDIVKNILKTNGIDFELTKDEMTQYELIIIKKMLSEILIFCNNAKNAQTNILKL